MDGQVYALKREEMANELSSGAFYALDDPLDATVFPAQVEMRGQVEIET
jgi:hypothetical protein